MKFIAGLLLGFFIAIVTQFKTYNSKVENMWPFNYGQNDNSVMSFNCDLHNSQQICNGILKDKHLWKCPYQNCEQGANWLMHEDDEILIECQKCNIKWTVHFERSNK